MAARSCRLFPPHHDDRPLSGDRPVLIMGTDDFVLAAISCNFC